MSTNAGSWLEMDSISGTIFGTPDNDDVGSYELEVSVVDVAGRGASQNFTLTVNNVAPEILTTDVETCVAWTLYMNDYDSTDDGQGAVWSMESDAAWLNPMDSEYGLLYGMPRNADSGTYWVNVSVDDGNGGTDYRNFTLTVLVDTDLDGIPDTTDPDDDNDGTPDVLDAFPLDPSESVDTDGDGIGDNADRDDDNDGWSDIVEIIGGTDPLDNTSMPGDEDNDGIGDFMDPDYLTRVEYHNVTVNRTIWHNITKNITKNVTIGVRDEDTDGDGWNDSVEIVAGTDPLDATSEPEDADGDGIADFMDSDMMGKGGVVKGREVPMWAYLSLVVAIVLGLLVLLLLLRSRGELLNREE